MTKPNAAAGSTDRLPPHSPEAEQGVLGCILLSPEESMGTCVERLKAGSLAFYDARHQEIYGAMLALHDSRRAVDVITVRQALKDADKLDAAGGTQYLDSLPNTVPSAANLEHYLDIVRGKFALRRLITVCTDATARAYAANRNVAEAIDGFMAQAEAVTEAEAEVREEHIKTIVRRVVDNVEKHYHRGSQQLDGLPLMPPNSYLDKLVRGVRPEHNVVLAARPGGGKTSFAMQIAEYLATDYVWWEETGETREPREGEEGPQPVYRERKGIPVGVISIEMDGDSLVKRMIFGRAGVDSAMFSQGFARKGDMDKFARAALELCKANIYIDATPAQTAGQIAAKARRMARQHGIKLFILDYIQLVEIEDGNGVDRVREITKISRKLMALKKQLRVPWLVLAQMNRNIETAKIEREPVLSDLKDCGALEQDADVVLFVHKTCRKDSEKERDGATDEERIERVCQKNGWSWGARPYRVDIIVAKNRFGPMGKCEMLFQKNFQRFEDRHAFFVRHGVEDRHAGESRSMEGGEEML